MTTVTPETCGCPPTLPVPTTSGVHHVIITVNELARSRPFYAALMPRLGYSGSWDAEGAPVIGWFGAGGSFWVKQAGARYLGERFSKDRVGLCEVAFRAESRDQVDALARDVEGFGGTILDPPREYAHYSPGYYSVFFADPDGIKLELVYLPG